MDNDRELSTEEAAEMAGMQRNSWSSLVARNMAPPPDGYTEKGKRPFWRESTISDFLAWKADPILSRPPSPPTQAARFAAWQRQHGSRVGKPEAARVDSIRRHRSFPVTALTDELRSLVRGAEVAE